MVAKISGVPKANIGELDKAISRRQLTGVGFKVVSPEQMEFTHLRAELARVKMERDILKKMVYFARESACSTPRLSVIKYTVVSHLQCAVLNGSVSGYFSHMLVLTSSKVHN